MDGKNIDDVEYFKGYLDSFDLTIKVTDDALYFSDISRVDGSNDKEAILKDLPVQGGLETYKYVKEGGSYVKQKDPMVDPYNDSVIYGWQRSSTFGNYKPALAFKSDTYKYGAYINNGTHYSLVGLNDSSSNAVMKQFIRAIAYDGLVASGAPIAYYISAGWMDFSLGENATSDVNCDFRVRLTTSTNYVYYCLKLSVTDINNTKISL